MNNPPKGLLLFIFIFYHGITEYNMLLSISFILIDGIIVVMVETRVSYLDVTILQGTYSLDCNVLIYIKLL